MTITTTNYHRTKHLGEDDLLPLSAGCPWCGGSQRKSLVDLQSEPNVSLLECHSCHAVSESRMPTPAALAHYYGQYYDDAQYDRSGEKVTIGDSLHMGRSLARWMQGRDSNGHLIVLDFGGGDGTVAAVAVQELLNQGHIKSGQITVVDYNNMIVSSNDPRIVIVHAPTLAYLTARKFHVVMASAVIEHIPDGRATLDELLSLVAPGGAFYARTPQVASFVRLSRYIGIRWDFTFPGHVHDLGQRFWEGLFSRPSMAKDFGIVLSKPSLVEARLADAPMRAMMAYLFKLPWYLLRRHWGFVGGWEITVTRR
jgi:SAM-dependent methyltransferase